MRNSPIRFTLTVSAALYLGVFAGTSAQAQSSDSFGGSFDDGGGTSAAEPAAQDATTTGDSFGGSFDGGDNTVAADTATPEPATTGDSFSGSFDGGGGIVAVEPADAEPSATGDGFGGSFEAGGDVVETTTPAVDADVPVVGGDSFGPGSFEPGFDVEIVESETTTPDEIEQEQVLPPGPKVDPQIVAFESRDFGIPPSQQLRQNDFHGPTPTSIPGAQVAATHVLADALQQGQQIILIDVLGSDYSLPNAYVEPGLASGGTYKDRTQQQARQWLRQITKGDRGAIIVIYCSDPMCWLSYNASLRAVAAGYTNVYWYRGGLQAWQMAGLQLYPTGF